jgi:L-amino acid N-acyltransferase YncA
MFSIREATEADLPAIFAIYNDAVLNSTATWETTEVLPAEQIAWFDEHQSPYAAIVAYDGEEVIGWASLSQYRPRQGYRFSAESTVYIHTERLRLGLGRVLVTEIIERARAAGFHTILGKISADNEASISLHTALGFEVVGHEREVGFKFGRWLDLVTMQLLLGD